MAPAETIRRVRHAGASEQLTVRADSVFYAHAVVAYRPRIRIDCPAISGGRGTPGMPDARR